MLELAGGGRPILDDSALHQVILENMAEGVCLLRSSDGVIVYSNRRLHELLGYGPGELEGRPASVLVAEEDRDRVQAELTAQLGERGEATWEAQLCRKDGSRVWCRVRVTEFVHPTFGPVRVALHEDISLTRAAQEQLRYNERLLRSVVDLLPVGVWLTDATGKIVSTNPAGLKVWQGARYVGPNEFSEYKGWWMDTGKLITAEEWALARAVTRGESSFGELIRIQCFDGTFKTVINSSAPLRDEAGKIVGAIAVNEDVTSLMELEARFQGIVSHAFDAIVVLDSAQKIEVFNRGAEVTFGYPASEVLGAPIDVLFPEAVRAEQRDALERFSSADPAADPPGERLHMRGLRKSGEEFPAEAALSLYSGGGPPLLTLTLRDVTVQKRAEDEQRFLAEIGGLLGSSLDVDRILDQVVSLGVRFLADFCAVEIVEDRRLRRIKTSAAHPGNERIARSLQELQLDAAGRSFPAEAVRSGKPVLYSSVTDDVLQAHAPDETHLRMMRLLKIASVMTIPMIARGRTLGAITFVSTHPRRAYGADDLRIAEQLAWRAAAAMDNALLYRTAQQASAARDELLAVVAHDLRTPLNSIAMTAQLLTRKLRAKSYDTAEDSAALIHDSTRQADRLIADLLDVARIESGALSVTLHRCESERLARAALADARSALEHHQTQVILPPGLPSVVADEGRVRQVLWNLLTNAAKFTPAGGTITVGAEPQGNAVRFWVADTGSGIAAENLERVFDRFSQLEMGDRRGVGLGLAICRSLIEAQGGRIWAQSVPGQGSTFSFTLPTDAPVVPGEEPQGNAPALDS